MAAYAENGDPDRECSKREESLHRDPHFHRGLRPQVVCYKSREHNDTPLVGWRRRTVWRMRTSALLGRGFFARGFGFCLRPGTDPRGVAPEAFEVVVLAHVGAHDVDDHVEIIQNKPASL